MERLDTRADWLAGNQWDGRHWVARTGSAPCEVNTPSLGSGELIARSYAREVEALYLEIQADGAADAANQLWSALSDQGWFAGEIEAAVRHYADAETVAMLRGRHAAREDYGPIAPPMRPVPEARRNIDGAVWDGDTWTPSTEGEPWPAPYECDWVRLRRASRGEVTKLFRPDGAGGWAADRAAKPPLRYRPEIVTVANDVDSWAAMLREWDAETLLVRGVMVANADERGEINRTRCGPAATLAPHPSGRRVIVCDLDKLNPGALGLRDWPADRWPTAAEGEALLQAAIKQRLPESFHAAAAAYRWSSSAGVPGGKRGPLGWSRPSAHVFFVLDRPVNDESLALWLDDKADPSVAHSEHALYLATPLFDGAPPPAWPEDFERVGTLDGEAEVVTPAELSDGEEWALEREVIAADLHALTLRRSLEARRLRDAAPRRRESLDERIQRTGASGAPLSAMERAKRWLDKRAPAISGAGGDRHTFTTAAAMVKDFNLADGEALDALRAWNARCVPPWSDDELRAKIANANAYATGATGAKLEKSNHGI